MRILPKYPAIDGWAVMAECHGCERITKYFLVMDNDHGSLLVICTRCITKIVDEAAERWGDDPGSQA